MSEVSLAPPPRHTAAHVQTPARATRRPSAARNVFLFLASAALTASVTAGVGPDVPPADILERPAAALRKWVESRVAPLSAVATQPSVIASRPLFAPDLAAPPVRIAERLAALPTAAAPADKHEPSLPQPTAPAPQQKAAAQLKAAAAAPRETGRTAAAQQAPRIAPPRGADPVVPASRAALNAPRLLAPEPSRAFNPDVVGMPVAENAPIRSVPPAPPAPAATATSGVAAQPPRATAATQLASDESDVRRLIEQYRGAYERLDANAAAVIWPTVDRRALARAFSDLESQTMRFDYCKVDVSVERGLVSCRGLASYVGRVGNRAGHLQQRQWTFVVRKNGEDWSIQSVRAQ